MRASSFINKDPQNQTLLLISSTADRKVSARNSFTLPSMIIHACQLENSEDMQNSTLKHLCRNNPSFICNYFSMHAKVQWELQQLKHGNVNTPIFMCIHWDYCLQTQTCWWNKKNVVSFRQLNSNHCGRMTLSPDGEVTCNLQEMGKSLKTQLWCKVG